MGSPEKPIDVEMGEMGDMEETQKLTQPDVKVEDGKEMVEPEEERFTGLKKEELLEISNQRKWVVARWILFALFWLGWIGMLVGAIIIVVKAPRCKKEPTPVWYQDTVVYEADVRKFAKDLEGMTAHLDYVRKLNAKTLTVCHANNPENPLKVVGDQESEFKELVKQAQGKDEEDKLKVVVDLRIDALSVASPQFSASAVKNCTIESTTPGCSLFLWRANGSDLAEDDVGMWKYHTDREEYYKVSKADNTLAFLNYMSQDAKDYLKDLLMAWIGYGADGFQLRDLSNVYNPPDIVEYARTVINDSQSDEENKRDIGLFLISSGSDLASQAELFGDRANDTTTPVVINNQMAGPLLENGTGQQLQNMIEKWRTMTYPNIGAYSVRTMDMSPLADVLDPARAAGLTLLTLTLPGVPVLRSGDEALLESDDLIWGEKAKVPQNASETNIGDLSSVADMRVSPFRSHQSLRWDNEDAKFQFLRTNSTDVIAFSRIWDTKPTIVVVSNPSVNNNVTVKVERASQDDEEPPTVIAPSGAKDKLMDNLVLKLNSGNTLVLEIKKS